MHEGYNLLLYTDGLTEHVSDEEIANLVAEHKPENAAQLLVAAAKERGGHDNVTALVVRARGEEQPRGKEMVLRQFRPGAVS